MISHLPCKKCGSCLPGVKGSIVKCPYCGGKNFYMESYYTLKYYASDILKLSSIRNEKKLKFKEIERRKYLIRSYFNKINSSFNEYRHFIITKLDKIDVDLLKLFYLIRASGNFEIIIERFLLPYLKEEETKTYFALYRDEAYVINKSLLAFYYTYLAKISNHSEKCYRFYQYAEKNLQNIVDYYNITELDNKELLTPSKGEIYSILVEFTALLRNILNRNPKLFSEKLEGLLRKIDKIEPKSIKIYNLSMQIELIYQLERDTYILLENIRSDDPFLLSGPLSEEKLLTSEENLDNLNRVRNWINNITHKYQKYQNSLLKLHSGRIIKYLEPIRTEFINYKNKSAEKFDDMLGKMINKALESYNSETVEAIETISNLMQKNIYNGSLIEKFQMSHDDLLKMDEVLKNFTENLFRIPLLRNLESEYYKELISLISGKHSVFDKYILKYIIKLLKDFEDLRSKNDLSLQEQRNKFMSEIKPNLQKLIDLSFTLNEEILPYPLFIDIKMQNHTLKVNNPELLTLIIENPNSTDIKNVMIYFFMPESFQNKLHITGIKKLKANETRKIKTRINPKIKGTFLSMVMIEYQHFNKTFWMPSIKLKLEVIESKKFVYNPIIYRSFFQNEMYATPILKFIRNFV
ncbi:MAG: hypothetical protein ACFFE4_22565 [Candidatus Thorarchaeota archaeon]